MTEKCVHTVVMEVGNFASGGKPVSAREYTEIRKREFWFGSCKVSLTKWPVITCLT